MSLNGNGKPKESTIAYGYTRVSTPEQYVSHLSIEDQRQTVRNYCVSKGLDLGTDDCRLCEEQASAFKLPFCERPLGMVLNRELKPGEHIIIAKLDRGFRNMQDALVTTRAWMDRGITVHILDMPMCGNAIFDRLLMAVLGWAAEFESYRRSERLVDAYRAARTRLAPMIKHAPYGYLWKGNRKKGTHTCRHDPNGRAHMRLIFELHYFHGMNSRAIEVYLMNHKIRPYDRRDLTVEWTKERQGKWVADAYNRCELYKLIRQQVEFEYIKAQVPGRTDEEAADIWFQAWCLDELPEDAELQPFLTRYVEEWHKVNDVRKERKKRGAYTRKQWRLKIEDRNIVDADGGNGSESRPEADPVCGA